MTTGQTQDRLDRARAAPRCCAKTRRGTLCQSPAMKNGRCRIHGGTSTGPRTPEGLARLRAARTTHGGRSRELDRFRREMRDMLMEAAEMIEQV